MRLVAVEIANAQCAVERNKNMEGTSNEAVCGTCGRQAMMHYSGSFIWITCGACGAVKRPGVDDPLNLDKDRELIFSETCLNCGKPLKMGAWAKFTGLCGKCEQALEAAIRGKSDGWKKRSSGRRVSPASEVQALRV